MSLSNLSQPQLERSVEILINNGALPQAQKAIAPVGYHPEALQQAAALLEAWRSGMAQAQALLTGQKRATQAEWAARRVAQKEVNRFRRTARTLFGSDETILSLLGLRPRRRTNGGAETNGVTEDGQNGENGSGTSTSRISRSAPATITRWRRMFANAQNLEEIQKTRMAAAGWPAERIAAAAALVEAFAQADTRQQEAIHTYHAQITATKVAEQELRAWYKEARQLVRVAIEHADSEDREKLHALLGV
jgi:hypothetical protein